MGFKMLQVSVLHLFANRLRLDYLDDLCGAPLLPKEARYRRGAQPVRRPPPEIGGVTTVTGWDLPTQSGTVWMSKNVKPPEMFFSFFFFFVECDILHITMCGFEFCVTRIVLQNVTYVYICAVITAI